MPMYVNVTYIFELENPLPRVVPRATRRHRKPTAPGYLRPPLPLQRAVAVAHNGAEKRWRSQPLVPTLSLFSHSQSLFGRAPVGASAPAPAGAVPNACFEKGSAWGAGQESEPFFTYAGET